MKLNTTATLFISMLMSALSSHTIAAAHVDQNIMVVGLFKNAAVFKIDDQRKLVRAGHYAGDIHLIAADSSKATVEINGKRLTLSMAENTPVRIGYVADTTNAQAHLLSSGGMYSVTGSINEQLTDFVVDTGATYITLSMQHAKRLRIDYSNAKKQMMNTANGKATAHIVTLEKIKIGNIELKNVKAAVMSDLSSDKVLLGMSFLNEVEMIHKNGLMVLKKRS